MDVHLVKVGVQRGNPSIPHNELHPINLNASQLSATRYAIQETIMNKNITKQMLG
jgi:hypothetical protein